LLYIQERLADIWEIYVLEDLETGVFEFPTVEDFLPKLKKEFGSRSNEIIKVAELKKIE